MKHDYQIRYDRVELKPLSEDKIEELRVLRNKERQWFVYHGEISKDQQVEWYHKYLKTQGDFMFEVYEKKRPDVFIGAVALYDIDAEEKTAEFGRIVIDTERTIERGLGYDTTCAACTIGFTLLDLKNIYLDVIIQNKRARKLYEKVGFEALDERQGMLRMVLNNNNFFDLRR